MQVRFSPPPVIDSPVARLDARWRLLALFVAMIAGATVRTLVGGIVAFVVVLLLAALARIDWRWFVSRLLVIALLLSLFIVPLPLLAQMSFADGLHLALVILLRALTIFTLGAVLLVTAPLDVSLKAASTLWVPGLLIHLMLLSYRYLFVLGDELVRLRVALRVRGFRNRPNLHSYRTVASASGTLLVRGYERGERVGAAMRCRGFDGQYRALVDFRTRLVDVLALGLVLLGAGAMVGLDLYLRN